MEKLTKRQRAIYEFVLSSINARGFPPTVAEIQAEFSFSSPTTAADHLKALARKGFIRIHRGVSRGIEVLRGRIGDGIPLVGRVAAGEPVLAVENIDYHLNVDLNIFSPAPDFALRVRGDSMIGAGIRDGDILLVDRQATAKDGDIVVALLGEEATVKRLKRTGGKIFLRPENDAMDDIPVGDGAELRILGIGVGVIRQKL